MQKKAIDRIRNNFSLEKQQKEFVNFYTTK
jgi:hypothetical protein